MCGPTVLASGGHALGGVGSITTAARRAIQVTPKTEANKKEAAKGSVGVYVVNMTKGKFMMYAVIHGHIGGRKDPKAASATNMLTQVENWMHNRTC